MRKTSLKNIFLVFSRDFQEYRKRKILWIFILFFIVGSIGCGTGMISAAARINDSSARGHDIWLMILGNVLVLYSIIPQIISIPLFSTTPLTYEKANGVVMSLIATQLQPAEIWLGKSLAVFVTGFVTGIISLVILLVSFETITAIPVSVILCAFVFLPIAMWMLSIITIQVSMVKSVEKAIAPSYILGFLLLAFFPAGAFTGAYVPGTVQFTVICFVIMALFIVVEIVLAKKITVENIILARVK